MRILISVVEYFDFVFFFSFLSLPCEAICSTFPLLLKIVNMADNMSINRQVQDELMYELQIRGIGVGTVDEMRKSITRALRMEKEGTALPEVLYPFTFDADAAAVPAKIVQIGAGIADMDRPESKKQKKLETQLHHLSGRINRSISRTEEERTTRADLLAKILALTMDLEDRSEEMVKLQQSISAEVSVLAS